MRVADRGSVAHLSKGARALLTRGAVLRAPPPPPPPTCRYVDSKGHACNEVAVCDIGLAGRDVLQRCKRHKRASAAQRRLNVSRFMFRRAWRRGLLSQLEMMLFLERSLESRLRIWDLRRPPDIDLDISDFNFDFEESY